MVKPMLNYIVRDCASLGVITSKLSSSISCQFRGPESCGKTATLHQVYAKLKQREGETVAYIDMKNMGVGVGYLEQLPGVKDIIFLVDNAQVLGTHSLLESSQRVRSIISRRTKSACYTFSPVVCDFYGNSVKAAGIKDTYIVMFTPFNETEFQQYISMYPQLSVCSTQIPGVLGQLKVNANATTTKESVIEMQTSLLHTDVCTLLQKLSGGLRKAESHLDANSVQKLLLLAIMYGCGTLTPNNGDDLINSGLGYRDANRAFRLLYSREALLPELNSHLSSLEEYIAGFSKGVALEVRFMFKVQNEDLVGENSSEMIYIPRPNVVWNQPKFGDVPDFI